ncbi:hypothetical protein [Nocardioides sp.]|uniref:hypothetical protein n=1 Tax=Nocardioides sp. TaxID=35761 RepID=UPI003D0D981A
MSGLRSTLDELPMPARWAVFGVLLLGAVGAVVGLIVGLRVHAATAWAATVEIGLPAAVLGGLLGLAAGSLASLARR